MKSILKELVEIINEKADLDLRDKSRKINYVMARCVFYDIAYNYIKYPTKSGLADYIGYNHATVIHYLNNLVPIMPKHYPRFYEIKLEIVEELGLNSEVDDLYKRHRKLVTKYSKLKEKYDNLEVSENPIINDILRMINSLPETKFPIVKERLEPMVKMMKV